MHLSHAGFHFCLESLSKASHSCLVSLLEEAASAHRSSYFEVGENRREGGLGQCVWV